jgi:hypothetical protein
VAITRITPIPARVRWDRIGDRPREIRWADQRFTVTSLATVRDERHAHRGDRGPRLTLVVDSDHGQAMLVYDAAARRWFVEGIDAAA